jgi:hypothetical protein
MTIYNQKYGFVYIWRDRKHNRYYIGCHWGNEHDGYVCSSPWMKQAYRIRPEDFKRRILTTNIQSRENTYIEEQKWLDLIKKEEISPQSSNPRYYNLNIKNNEVWHKYEDSIKTVGAKISKANKGRIAGPCSPEKAQNISNAKKEKFAKKEAELGYRFDPEHATKLSEGRKGKKHTEEWKQDNSVRMTKQWNDGTRKRAEPKMSMTPEEQAELSSKRLKGLWSDPDWAAKQSERLKEGARSRPPRSDESKARARDSQLGMPKLGNRTTYRITFMTGEVIEHTGLKSLVEQYSVPASTVGGAIREQKSLPRYNIMSIEKVN